MDQYSKPLSESIIVVYPVLIADNECVWSTNGLYSIDSTQALLLVNHWQHMHVLVLPDLEAGARWMKKQLQ